jgi:hypothetical protein
MDKRPYTCVLVSDFNLQNFAGYAANDPEFPNLKPVAAPLGQPVPTLLDIAAPHWQNTPDLAVIWTQPQSVISAFNALLTYEQAPVRKVLQEVDAYCSLLVNMSERVRWVLVPSWVLPTYRSVFGVLDMKTEIGLTNTLMRMNLRLAENLEKVPTIHVLNTHKWIERAGMSAFNPKLWYLGKIPFGNEVFKEAVQDIKAALRGMLGYARKLIVIDLGGHRRRGRMGESPIGRASSHRGSLCRFPACLEIHEEPGDSPRTREQERGADRIGGHQKTPGNGPRIGRFCRMAH